MSRNKLVELHTNFKAFNDEESDSVVIEGYANTSTKDRMGDVIPPSAWNKGGLENFKKNPIILAFHDHSKPIGRVTEHAVGDNGLFIKAKISKAAGNIYNLIKEGILKAFSVGFIVKDADYDLDTDLFIIKDLELLEISVVSVGANQDSTFSLSKSFDSDTEYNEFKQQFMKSTSEEDTMSQKGVKTSTTESGKSPEHSNEDTKFPTKDTIRTIISEELKNMTQENNKSTEQPVEEKTQESKGSVEVGAPEVERLMKTIEDRFNNNESSIADALKDVLGEVKESREDMLAMQRSKMQFQEKTAPIAQKDIDEAVLLSKAMGRPIEQTTLGKQLVQKAGDHVPSADWEQEFSTRVFNEMRQRLIVEDLFRMVPMNAPTMNIPINPEAGYGEWIGSADFKGSSSTGTAGTHQLNEIDLKAYKLVAKEYLGYEEEEDTILPLLPLIRDAIVRRMAKSADKALLVGAGGTAADPITGLATLASDASNNGTQLSIGSSDKMTVASLQSARRDLGVWGLQPSDVVYIVSTEAYYDLLEDADFRTMDKVGDNATILTGQIGMANGSPVIVSGEFKAVSAGNAAAVAVNVSNFMVGNLRTMVVERDRNIEEQKNILVASRRLGFVPAVSGEGVASVVYAT